MVSNGNEKMLTKCRRTQQIRQVCFVEAVQLTNYVLMRFELQHDRHTQVLDSQLSKNTSKKKAKGQERNKSYGKQALH